MIDKYIITNIDRNIDKDDSIQLYITWTTTSTYKMVIRRVRLANIEASNLFAEQLRKEYNDVEEVPEDIELEFLANEINDKI